ncbi:MAG: BMP family protein [Candidatus Thorarchaeota archaeon]
MSSSRSSVIASIVIVVIVFGSVGGLLFLTNQYEPSSVAVVVMNPGFGDSSRADQIYEGMMDTASEVSVQYYTPDAPATESEAETLIENLAASGHHQLIIVVGHELQDELQRVAALYPNQKFAMIGGFVNLDNVASATFEVHEAAFIAGVVAAFVASDDPYNGTVGILGSVPTDHDGQRMIAGFTQGVETANTAYDLNVELLSPRYVGSYNDSATAASMVETLYTVDFCSVVFTPVRASIWGIREGMLAANETLSILDRRPLAIAAEMNQDYIGNPNPNIATGPSWMITSVVIRSDVALNHIIVETLWDRFPGGQNFNYNLENMGVNITDFRFSNTVVDWDYIHLAWDFSQAVINGTITVNDS